MRAVALILIGALELCGQGTNVVEGTVATPTGAPVGGVQVELRRLSDMRTLRSETAYSTLSDEQGRFRFEDVAEGDYFPAYTKYGLFAYQSFATPAGKGGWITNEQSVAMPVFHVGAGIPSIKLTVSLEPNAQISGRVVNEENRPVAGMAVTLVSAVGHMIRGGQDSDAEGRFTIAAPSGSYYLVASRSVSPGVRTGPMINGLRFWYPGVIQFEDAQRVQVRAGVQVYDIKVRNPTVHGVHGVVVDERGADPVPGVGVTLYQLDRWDLVNARTVSEKDGAFHFEGVPDGKWRLFAANTNDPAKRRGYAEIFVSKGDVEGANVQLALPWSQKGRIEQDDDAVPATNSVTLVPLDFPLGGDYTAQRGADGSFRVERVYPGRYRIAATATSARYYLASILVGEGEVLGEAVELREGAPEIHVKFRSDGGVVQGDVEKCSGATVALVPDEPALFSLFLRTARCDPKGRFTMTNVRPGNYSALAFGDPNAVRDESYVRGVLLQAESVRVKARETVRVESVRVVAGE